MLNPYRLSYRFLIVSVLIISCCTACKEKIVDLPPPNILWITCEDMSLQLGSYGDEYAHSPNLDQLAAEGVVYTQAFASAPVCAVARSGIITGMYASSLGSQHMRCKGKLPTAIKTYPHYLRQAGYYCTNNVKTDYNLNFDNKSIWDDCSNNAHWRNRKDPEQPFFAIFNFVTTHESRVNNLETHQKAIANVPTELLKQPGDIPIPPYFPDTDRVRDLWTRYYNNITAMDMQVGELLKQLQEDGLTENTIILFYSDHGAGIPRYKRWLYDTGLQVPLIVKVPEKYRHLLPHQVGSKVDELVSFIDFPSTALKLADIPIPTNMEGRAFLGTDLSPPRAYIYAGRDRMDERYDMQRAVRDKKYKYIRYYESYKPYCQYMNTPEKGEIMMAIRAAAADGSLPEAGQHMVAENKPEEELFDTEKDPFELNNLAMDPAYEQVLAKMREAHDRWSDDTKDTGLIPETILRKWEEEANVPIYEINRTQEIPISHIRETALARRKNNELIEDLKHENDAVRYWAAIHLGNRAAELSDKTPLVNALEDQVPTVAIAAARALCKMDDPALALATLQEHLQNDDEWTRLVAAQVLDEIEDQARPAISALQGVMEDKNKYVVRVANRALNQMLGTQNVVR